MTLPTVPAYDWVPLLPVLAIGAVLALAAVGWRWWRVRKAGPEARIRALAALTLFLTFDLILFGAYTRLSDSGLGCPDWPGCYGTASPVGARAHIEAAQTALPTGPVTHGKAWIEMIHRYLATAVGGLILLMAVMSWWRVARRRRGGAAPAAVSPPATAPPPAPLPATESPGWATATLAWVCLQGAFGAWTVTMKLYPAIVTAHLIGGYGLLVLLALQFDRHRSVPRPAMSRALRAGTLAVAGLAVLQAALGGWVSTNYAVLACRDFPTCQGSFWPTMDFADAYTLRRGLGLSASGGYLAFAALTAIHFVHRIGAVVLLTAVGLLAIGLRATGDRSLARWSLAIGAAGAWQVLTGLGNVVLDWPIAAALAHTGGAAVLIGLLAVLASRAQAQVRAREGARAARDATGVLPGRAPVALDRSAALDRRATLDGRAPAIASVSSAPSAGRLRQAP